MGSEAKPHFKEAYLPWPPVLEPITDSPIKNTLPKATDRGFVRPPIGRRSDWQPALTQPFVFILDFANFRYETAGSTSVRPHPEMSHFRMKRIADSL